MGDTPARQVSIESYEAHIIFKFQRGLTSAVALLGILRLVELVAGTATFRGSPANLVSPIVLKESRFSRMLRSLEEPNLLQVFWKMPL